MELASEVFWCAWGALLVSQNIGGVAEVFLRWFSSKPMGLLNLLPAWCVSENIWTCGMPENGHQISGSNFQTNQWLSIVIIRRESYLHSLLEWVVGGLEHFYVSIYWGQSLPTDFHIFQKGWNHQPVDHGIAKHSQDFRSWHSCD